MRRVWLSGGFLSLSAALFVWLGGQLDTPVLWPSSLSSGPSAQVAGTANPADPSPELAALGAEPPGRGDGRLHSLVLELGAPIHWSSVNPAAARARLVRVNPDLLRVEDNPVEIGDRIALQTPDGRILEARVEQRRRWGRAARTFTLTARVLNQADSFLVLSSTGGVIRAAVDNGAGGPDYQLRYDVTRGEHVLLEIDRERSEFLGCGHGSLRRPPTHGAEAAEASGGPESGGALPEGDQPVSSTVHDFMAIYTPAALASEGSLANLEANISQSVAIANLVHDNSGTLAELNLVHSAEVDFVESPDAYDDLELITDYGDGVMDEVHYLRERHGADFVSFFISTGQVGGLGWRPRTYNELAQAFSLVRVQQSDNTTTYTLAHEVSHNMGNGHSKTQSSGAYDGIGIGSYAAGWQWADASAAPAGKVGYCSVMTYEDFDGREGREYDRIAYFSNPSIFYKGRPTGDPVHGDAARTIREGASIHAGFSTPLPAIDDFPYELGFEADEASWRHLPGLDLAWTTDGSEPTPSFFTGPDGPYSGSRYAYIEASGSLGESSILLARVDLSSTSQPVLSFAYHMFDNDAGDMGELHLELSVDEGRSWTTLCTRGATRATSGGRPKFHSPSMPERKCSFGSGARSVRVSAATWRSTRSALRTRRRAIRRPLSPTGSALIRTSTTGPRRGIRMATG